MDRLRGRLQVTPRAPRPLSTVIAFRPEKRQIDHRRFLKRQSKSSIFWAACSRARSSQANIDLLEVGRSAPAPPPRLTPIELVQRLFVPEQHRSSGTVPRRDAYDRLAQVADAAGCRVLDSKPFNSPQSSPCAYRRSRGADLFSPNERIRVDAFGRPANSAKMDLHPFGPDGLGDRPKSGRKIFVDKDRLKVEWLEKGPETDGLVRGRVQDVTSKTSFGVRYSMEGTRRAEIGLSSRLAASAPSQGKARGSRGIP